MNSKSLKRGISFLVIGVVSSAAYLATMSVCVDFLNISAVFSAFAAFWVGTIISYLGNTLFTFQSAVTKGTMLRFLSVVLLGLGVNQAIAYCLSQAGVHYVVIALTVFVLVPVVNFIGHSAFTYREGRI
jgi:putative flippase GtrA